MFKTKFKTIVHYDYYLWLLRNRSMCITTTYLEMTIMPILLKPTTRKFTNSHGLFKIWKNA